MAVLLEFISVIVPVWVISAKCGPRRWEEHFSKLDFCVWNDGTLFRDGAMNPHDIGEMVREWEREGLTPKGGTPEQPFWQDLCVVDYLSGPTLPCPWLAYDPVEHCVWLAGRPRGPLVGPRDRDIARDAVRIDPPPRGDKP